MHTRSIGWSRWLRYSRTRTEGLPLWTSRHAFQTTPPLSAKAKKPPTPHEILGVLETATDEEIRKQYRSLAKKFHPDVYKEPDAEKRFLEIQKAYSMIKDEAARDKTKVVQDLGDDLDGIDLEQLDEAEREVIVSVLNRIRNGQSAAGGYIPARVAYEVSKMRNKTSEFFYTASSVTEKLPHYLAMFAPQPIFDDPSPDISFLLFSRLPDQNALGKVTYHPGPKKMEWMTQDDRLVASATVCAENNTAWATTQSFMVRSRGKVVGTFTTRYLRAFPMASLISIIPAGEDAPRCMGRRLSLFGSRLTWHSPSAKTLCIAHRGFWAPMGRVFDVDISSHHDDIHPALYLFAVAQNHLVDTKFQFLSPLFSPLARRIIERQTGEKE